MTLLRYLFLFLFTYVFGMGLGALAWADDMQPLNFPPIAPVSASAAMPASNPLPEHVFLLSYSDAEDAVMRALVEKGAGEKISATVNGRHSDALFSYGKPITADIKGLNFEKPSGRFSANLLIMSGNEVVSAMPIGGIFNEMVTIPILKHDVRNTEIIGQADIELRDFPVARTRSDTINDQAALIGKSPVRGISANRPIRESELGNPALIKKNALVQMRYLSPGMEISASGQAMDDGAKGSVIAVRNISSKKIVRAVVEDASTVSVTPTPLSPAAENAPLKGDAYAIN